MKRSLILVLAATLCTSCANIVYDGLIFPVTRDIQIFNDLNEIDREYVIMGILKVSGSGLFSGSNLEGKIGQAGAQERG